MTDDVAMGDVLPTTDTFHSSGRRLSAKILSELGRLSAIRTDGYDR
jgi:hypothetical protein